MTISVLPTETFVYIFELGRPASSDGKTSNYPFILASVCRLWRSIAVRLTPLIWNSITMTIYRPLHIPLLYIERSGDLPLHLHLGTDPELNPVTLPQTEKKSLFLEAVRILHKYLHRWESLNIIADLYEFSVIMDSLRHAKAPKLRALRLGCWNKFVEGFYSNLSPIFMDNGVPNLTSLALHSIPNLTLLLQPSLSLVTKLELYDCGVLMTHPDFASSLNSFRVVQQLTLSCSGPNVYDVQRGKIILPSLLALELAGSDIFALSFLETPLLHTLKLPATSSYMFGTSMTSTRASEFITRKIQELRLDTLIMYGVNRSADEVEKDLRAVLDVKHVVFQEI